jgi:hypothetical protein
MRLVLNKVVEVAETLDRLIETGEPQSVLGQGERWTYSLPLEVPA